MSKIGVEISTTVGFERNTIEFSKMSVSIQEIDLEIPLEDQLKDFDEKVNEASKKILKSIKNNLIDKAKKVTDGK